MRGHGHFFEITNPSTLSYGHPKQVKIKYIPYFGYKKHSLKNSFKQSLETNSDSVLSNSLSNITKKRKFAKRPHLSLKRKYITKNKLTNCILDLNKQNSKKSLKKIKSQNIFTYNVSYNSALKKLLNGERIDSHDATLLRSIGGKKGIPHNKLSKQDYVLEKEFSSPI